MTTNATMQELSQALAIVNLRYADNVLFENTTTLSPKRNRFTLRTKNSHNAGSRLTHQGRHIPKACWHVHGHFFEALFSIRADIYIISGGKGRITKDAGNWEDRNIGSIMVPMMFSDACECGHHVKFATLEKDGARLKETNIRMIKQSDFQKCPFFIMVPSHYRDDGSCKCNDPEERKMMMKEWEYTKADFIAKGVI